MADPAIITKIGGDASGFAAALDQALVKADKFQETLSKRFDGRALALGLFAALGIGVEKIAEKIARLWTGVSEEAEASYKNIGRLSDELTEKTIAANQRQLEDGKRLTMLTRELFSLQDKIASALGSTVFNQEKLLELQTKERTVLDGIASLREKIRADESKELDRQFEEGLKNSREDYRIKKEAALEAKQRSDKAFEEDLKWYKERARLEGELRNQKIAAMKPEERTAELQREVTDLKRQQAKLDKDDNEYKAIQVKINEANRLIEAERLVIAQQMSSEQAKGVEAINEQQKATNTLASMWEEMRVLIDGVWYGATRGVEKFIEASDAALRQVIAQNKSKLSKIDAGKGYGDTALVEAVTGYLNRGIVESRLNTENARAEAELKKRNSLRFDYAFGGESLARKNYQGDAFAFDGDLQKALGTNTIASEMLAKNKQIADGIEKLNARLKQGIPVVYMGGNG